ncbi:MULTISPECIES: GAF domain-containing protein [unclassified Acidovorax]|uniref:GAF domain-containing protein n=1 Tax=unclassified Acidovorax TaxID=2684926 RepID=UPI0006FC209C|nr:MULTISPECIES: GAF domain-containing protein [unclassified Acidovorax]KRB35575.1 histidine kinase [Acidovorax sp. Root70]PUA99211.1 GAF domain-containing protein [Acidovorax sp. 107]
MHLLDYNPDDLDVTITELLVATSDSADHELPSVVSTVLQLLRNRMGMDVAFVSQFVDGRRTIQAVDSLSDFSPLEPGMSDPVEESWCQRVVEGRLPEKIDNAAPYIASGKAPDPGFPIGTHLSAPVRLAGGKVYGTLCCFSRGVKADGDIDRLRYSANLLAQKLSPQATESTF